MSERGAGDQVLEDYNELKSFEIGLTSVGGRLRGLLATGLGRGSYLIWKRIPDFKGLGQWPDSRSTT